jgi:Tol biopolymer transport system component
MVGAGVVLSPLFTSTGVPAQSFIGASTALVAYARIWTDQQRGQGHFWISVADLSGAGRHDITARPPRDHMTFDGDGYSPVWSPDGSRLAYMRLGMGVYTANRDGSQPRRVLPLGSASFGDLFNAGNEPAWSPDGQRLAASDGVVYVVNQDGTGKLKIGQGANPAWSPDGRTLVYLSNGEPGDGAIGAPGYRTLYRIDADGTHRRLLARGSFSDAAWSPNGGSIAYTSDCIGYHSNPVEWHCSLSLMRSDGSDKRALARAQDVNGWVEWVDSGRQLLWSSRVEAPPPPAEKGPGLFLTDPISGRTRALLPGYIALERAAGISKDGRTIAVVKNLPSERHQLIVTTLNGRQIKRVSTPPGWQYTYASVYLPSSP